MRKEQYIKSEETTSNDEALLENDALPEEVLEQNSESFAFQYYYDDAYGYQMYNADEITEGIVKENKENQ
ncbi:MAG: hypothetical protein ACK5NT_10585 [Pyrinomonadaceae bacterium]